MFSRLEYEVKQNNWVRAGFRLYRWDRPNKPPVFMACDGQSWKAACWVSDSEGVKLPEGNGNGKGMRTPADVFGQYPDNSQGVCAPFPCPSPTPCPPSPSPVPSASPSASPNPQATPATCPPLRRVGGGLFACQHKGVSKPCSDLAEGDEAVIDTTHHFGRRQAASCDEPWDTACGGRICSGTGTAFDVQRGQGCVESGTHQLDCKNMARGSYRVVACALVPYVDAEGFPVDTSNVECTTIEWDVR